MRRFADSQTDAGSDSFLDIVANIVGILIILVMVVGARVKRDLPEEPPAAAAEELKALEDQALRAAGAARSLEGEVVALAEQMENLSQEVEVRRAARGRLLLAAEQMRRDLEARQAALDTQRRDALATGQQLEVSRRQLEELKRQLALVQQQIPETIKLLSYPTPIAHTVHGEEAHFQIRNGLVAYVPIEELIDELRRQARELVGQLRDLPEVGGTVGPVHGFRMRYTFARVDVPVEMADRGSRRTFIGGGRYAQLVEFTLAPERGDLGETLEEALDPQSDLRTRLAALPQGRTTVTLWVYPDGFEMFRTLRKELYLLGYQVAGRPLPEGVPISGSPHGSKSAAQ